MMFVTFVIMCFILSMRHEEKQKLKEEMVVGYVMG